MPPEDSVRSWALVRYSGSFFDYASYTILALQVHFDTESYMKVDDQIKQKAAEIVAGANTPEQKLQRIFDFCRTKIKNTGQICRHDISIGVTNDQKTLVYTRTFFFGGKDMLLFPAANYDQLKRLFDEVHKADNHLITLKQVGSACPEIRRK